MTKTERTIYAILGPTRYNIFPLVCAVDQVMHLLFECKVAMEDILEVIVGNIQDEYDNDEPVIQKIDDDTYLISGLAPLAKVAEELGIEFEETEFETLNGYLISRLDKIPDEDEHSRIEACGYLFQIEKVANKMIETVRVRRLPEEAVADEIQE